MSENTKQINLNKNPIDPFTLEQQPFLKVHAFEFLSGTSENLIATYPHLSKYKSQIEFLLPDYSDSVGARLVDSSLFSLHYQHI